MVLARRWHETLAVDLKFVRPDADLSTVGPSHAPLANDDVPIVELLPHCELFR